MCVLQEAVEKSNELLSQAKLKLAEQDDEIKQLNETILNAKCHAIRDIQLEEKSEIQRAMEEEEVYMYIHVHVVLGL